MNRDIDVIIPTTAEPTRERSLLRALDSVRAQEGVTARPIVVLNGNRVRPGFERELSGIGGVRVVRQTMPSLPLAIRTGRECVRADFFAYLDDDDEYLEGALTRRLDALAGDEDVALVVTNGYKVIDGHSSSLYPTMKVFDADPLYSLAESNWLASCGGLYRSNKVSKTYFDPNVEYFEWTSVAFNIALNKLEIRFLDDMTFQINETAGSLSATDEYVLAAPQFIDTLLRNELPRHVRQGFERKKRNLEHAVCKHFLQKGDKKTALNFHLRSMRGLHGFIRHASFTPHIIFS